VTVASKVRVVVLVATVLIAAQWLRMWLGIHPSVDAVRAWADGLGWCAPAAFLGLVVLRQFVLLPAVLLLTAGGMIFGGVLGTMLGGTGIILSGIFNFVLARRVGDVIIPGEWRARLHRLSARGPTAVAAFIGLATLHPVGPLQAAHWAAGCSTIAASTFVLLIVPASYARAAALASFGSTLGAWSFGSLVLTVGLLAAVVLPLAVPSVRRRLFPAPTAPTD
jgi:uncharacterized membrane protein YdjX (TVP38/TMEM64 family)